jgi:heme-degrading monooxygenase HmoA
MNYMIAKTPKPPYYAVIFSSLKRENTDDYGKMANKMEILAHEQIGFLGMESARNEIGITVSYWDSLEAIKNWKFNVEHLEAQKLGKILWYKTFKVRICKVERDYDFER